MWLCLIILSLVACSGGTSNVTKYKAGSYTGESQGFGGIVKVTITIDEEGNIEEAALEAESETENGQSALETLRKQIIDKQGSEIDIVGGATTTSNAVIKALDNALLQARADNEISESNPYKAGIYTSEVTGMFGKFDVIVEFNENHVLSIYYENSSESEMLGSRAQELLAQRCLTTQSLVLDVVSGATQTSEAVIAGIKDCFYQAGANLESLENKNVYDLQYDYLKANKEADIIVVGAGLAGLNAALTAAQNGKSVILLEQNAYVGGNALISEGIFLLGGTSIQEGLAVSDSAEKFADWQIKSGGNEKNEALVKAISNNSQTLIDNYKKLGIDFTSDKLTVIEGSDVYRGHTLANSMGSAIKILWNACQEAGVEIRYCSTATSLIMDGNKVTGVNVTDYYLNELQYFGNKVILATGGWGNDSTLLKENWGESYADIKYTGLNKGSANIFNSATNDAKAAVVDMEDIHLDVTASSDNTNIRINSDILRYSDGILITKAGKRFANESQYRFTDAISKMHESDDEYFYEIFDASAKDYSKSLEEDINDYERLDIITYYDSIEALADGENIDVKTLKNTIDSFNGAVNGLKTDEFKRTRFQNGLQVPYYVIKVNNGVSVTTGGLKVNEKFQVLNNDNKAIEGLYAIGEIAGGYLVGYLNGSALSYAAISGIIVGSQD